MAKANKLLRREAVGVVLKEGDFNPDIRRRGLSLSSCSGELEIVAVERHHERGCRRAKRRRRLTVDLSDQTFASAANSRNFVIAVCDVFSPMNDETIVSVRVDSRVNCQLKHPIISKLLNNNQYYPLAP